MKYVFLAALPTLSVGLTLLFFLRKKIDFLMKICLIILVSLMLLQSIYVFIEYDNSHSTVNSYNDSKKSSELLLISPKDIIETVKKQISEEEFNFINSFLPSDVKYIQMDNDYDYEIVIHNNNLEKSNFLLLDYEDGAYKSLLTQQNIKDYYMADNNHYLVLVTKFLSPGTGVCESNFLVYKLGNSSISKVFSDIKDSVYSKAESNRIEKHSGNISISNDKLTYSYTDYTVEESSKTLDSKSQEKQILLIPQK